MTDPARLTWRDRYEALAKETLEVYALVYNQLTDEKRRMSAEERAAAAANELYWAAQSLEARRVFDNSEVGS